MPVTQDASAPYAPPSAILSLVERHRNKGLPSPVDTDTLVRAGISESLVPRTLQAMATLDLLDSDGKPTETLEALRLASESEYKARMADWLRATYADALNYIEPDADETAIRDAFRSYNPVGQQPRMVTLFAGLFAAAGLREATERKVQSREVKKTNSMRVPPRRAFAGKQDGGSANNKPPNTGLPPAIAGLLHSIPSESEGWTKEKRDLFLVTFGSVLDFCIPIKSDEDANKGNTGGQDE